MDLFQNWRPSRGIMQLLIIKLVCCLGWLSSVALGQVEVSEGLTGSINNFPTLGITCVANLAIFVTSLIRGRLDLEIGARDALDILASPKLHKIDGMNGNGLTTLNTEEELRKTEAEAGMNEKGLTTEEKLGSASVVILSNGTPNSSVREFMKSNANYAHSILLQFFLLKSDPDPLKKKSDPDSLNIPETTRQCSQSQCNECKCIVFRTMEEVTTMLDRRMPGVLKPLSNLLCLLPCVSCFKYGCHGLQFPVDGPVPVVSEIIDEISARSIREAKPICICIPLHGAGDDVWTNLLVRSFRSKDGEGRGVRVMASEALEGYLNGGRGGQKGTVEYTVSSFLMPRLTEVIINLILTLWFKVDGFSSSLVARRTMRDFLVDTKGNGFAANAFLTRAVVKSDDKNAQVCQLLTFRSGVLGIKGLFLMVGCVNLISSIVWAVLIAFEDGADASQRPSMPILVVMLAAIGIALWMDSLSMWFRRGRGILDLLLLSMAISFSPLLLPLVLLGLLLPFRKNRETGNVDYGAIMFMTAIALEISCIVSGITVARTVGIKSFGRWIYGVFQTLVWVKWASGSFILNGEISLEFLGKIPQEWGILAYSSAFMLNAVLAGVRCKWDAWPWKDNHLFSRKLWP